MTQVKYYLPKNADNYAEVRKKLARTLARTFGGFTVYEECSGGWIDDGNLVTDPVCVIESFTDQKARDIDVWCDYQARDIKSLTNEDSILFTINTEAHFA